MLLLYKRPFNLCVYMCGAENFSPVIPIFLLVNTPWLLRYQLETVFTLTFKGENITNCGSSSENNKPLEAMTDADVLHKAGTDNA